MMNNDKYFYSDMIAAPNGYLTVGDWVVYDNNDHLHVASIARVIDFEVDPYATVVVVLEAPDGNNTRIVRRHFSNIHCGEMKKITNHKF